MEKVQMMRWYVVHTHPHAEARALRHLNNQGFRCFLPRIVELRCHARQARPVFAPLVPRYLFVQFDLNVSRWRAVNGTRGVVCLLTSGPQPLPVPQGVVETLLAKCDAHAAVRLAWILTKGLKVRIKSGAFSGQTGELAEIFIEGCDRVGVLLTLLGAQTKLEVPSYAVEAA
jgi:transcriptional antiterminator RfaH